MKILGIQKRQIEVEITEDDLGYVLLQKVSEMCDEGDPFCIWYTRGVDVYITGDEDKLVVTDGNIAALVDAANILLYGRRLKGKN